MKYFSYPVLLLFIFQLAVKQSAAQLFPGMRVNGKTRISGDTVNVCKGSSLLYESTASGYTSIKWEFQNGTPSTSTAFLPQTITYNNVGVDSTRQIISDGIGSDSMFIYVRVSDIKPTAGYSFAPNNVCGSTPIVFTNSSTGTGNTYTWDFGDTKTATAVSPSHQFLAATGVAGSQTYDVKLVATNIYGCKDSVTKTVTVQKIPDASIGNGDAQVLFGPFNGVPTFRKCAINPSYLFQFTNASSTNGGNISYKIKWGDGTPDTTFTSWPSATILQHNYPIGNSILTLEVTGTSGCTGIKQYNVFLGTNPGGGFASLGNTDICAPDSLRFVITGYNNNAPGTIYRISVNDVNTPEIYTHPPPDTVTHLFNYTSCGTSSSNGANVFPNSFRATLDIENPCASTSVSVIPILVSGKPRALISTSPDNVICTGSTVYISDGGYYGGVVTPTGGGNSTCVNNGKQVWVISPSTGFTITNGTLGSLNGSNSNGFVWTSGTTYLYANFTTPGTYKIKLYIFNERCGMDSTEKAICIRNPPQAGFTMDNKSACETGTAKFTNTSASSGGCLGDNYTWTVTYTDPLNCGISTGTDYSFINGTSSSSKDPQIQFNTPGKYIIQLVTAAIASSSCPSSVKRDTFTVKNKPKVVINPINSICANNTISPTATISGCYADSTLKYNWTFTNGTPASSLLVVPGAVNYTALGTHPIQLVVSSECNNTAAGSQVNIIAPPPSNAGADKSICSDGGTGIGVIGTPGITYTWTPLTGLINNGNGTANLVLSYTGVNPDTTYKYVVTSSGGINCSSTDTVSVTVKKRPTIIPDPLLAAVCEGLSTQLTVTGAVLYDWSPAASLNVTNNDTVIARPLSNTQYQVVGTAANGCTDTAFITVNVQPYPQTDAGNDSLVCNNTNVVQFIGSPAGGIWSGNNITNAGMFNPQAAGNGSYFIKYSATLNQCTKADSLRVTVIDPPVAKAGNDTTVCESTISIPFIGSPSGGVWSGSALITANGDFTPSASGSYQLIYTFGSGSCIAKDTIVVTVNDSITNNIISPSQSVCTNTQPAIINGQTATGGAGTPAYQWQRSIDGITWIAIPGATSLSYTPPVLTTTTFYRRIAYTTLCSGVLGSFSVPVKITVREDSKADYTASPATGCTPFDLGTVINLNTYADRNGQYNWYADGISIGSNPIGFFPGYIMQNTDDTVIIKLVTASQYGCKADSLQRQFITFRTAVAKFTKGNAKGCGPLTVPFTNTSNLINGIEFFWDFGNGQTSNAAQPGSIEFNTSAYFNDTTYYVTLKAYNGCDTTLWKDSVEVRANPKSRFGVSTTSGCSPLPLQISNTSLGGPNTYYWDFGNNDLDTTFTTGTFNYTYNTGTLVDTFPIRLIAKNECGSDTSSIDIRIAPNVIIPQINIGGAELYGCAPHIVNFINSTAGATGYRWDFGDGTPIITTSNNERRVVHTYNQPGDFNIKIDITNGCSDTTVFRQVTVYAKPAANFTTNATIYCLGDTVKVNNTSANASNYRWFWGDGQTDAGDAPVHVYTTAGNYDILLRAERTNNFGVVCFDTLVVPISLQVKPDVTIQTNLSLSNCAPFTLTASAPAIINENVDWYFYDTTVTPSVITANGVAAQYTFNKAGTFKVKMIATNVFGCKDSTERTFTIKATPVASFTPGDLQVCKTDTIISYLNTTTYNDFGPLSYRWLVDNTQFGTTGNFTHQYTGNIAALPKVFTTSMIVTNTIGCSDTAVATVQLNPLPDASFSIINPNNCVPFIPTIVDNSNYVTDYKWLLNGQLVSTDPNPSVVITQPSTLYTLTLVGDNIYGCTPDVFAVNFTSRIKPLASFAVNDTLGCNGFLNVATNNQTTNANSYTWDWGDGSPTVAFNSPTHLYQNLGQYVISLIASDGVCKDTALQNVTVSTKPIVDFSADPLIGCGTLTVQFSNLSQDADEFVWDFGNGEISNSTNPQANLAPKNSPYTIKLVAYKGACKDSLIKPNYILAKIPPAADFIINPSPVITIPNYTFSFTNLTPNSNKYTYQWDLDDGTFANTRDVPDHKYADTGNYYIQLIVLDTNMNCTDTVIKIARIDGIPGFLYVPNSFYPNSIQTQFRTFKPLGKGLAEYHFQVFDNWGKLLFESRELDATGAPVAAWDGTFKGSPMAQDTYVWKITAKFKNGKQWDGMVYSNMPGKKSGITFGTINLFR